MAHPRPFRDHGDQPPPTPVDRGSGAGRAFRATLVGTFAAVALGLIALDVVVTGALRPQLSELTRIADEHARAVSIATRLSEQIAVVRRRAVAAFDAPRGSSPGWDARGDIEGWRLSARALQDLVGAPSERASVARLKAAIDDSERIATQAREANAAGDGVRFRTDLDRLLDASAKANDAADEIVLYHAGQVRRSTDAVHASLQWLIVAASALTLVILGGALLLLRYALAGASRHAALLEQHASEMAAFAGRAAHELRTPLQSLALALAAIRKGRGEAVDRAEASARRLRETIDEILEFSRSGAVAADGAVADVRCVVDEVVDELAPRAAEAGVLVETHVASLPPVAMAHGHLRTVLRNLAGNAITYSARTPGARVEIRCRADGERAEIVVSDNGPGIPRQALPHVFEPFFRATAQPGGYGIGLAMVKRLVDAHRGNVAITSEHDRGTTVVVDLPLASPEAVGPEASATSAER